MEGEQRCRFLTCQDAQISGAVRDQSGAVLPGVKVSATETDTGIRRTTITNETGSYEAVSCGPSEGFHLCGEAGDSGPEGRDAERQTETVQNLSRRVGQVNCCKNFHPAPATFAFKNINQKNSFHQFGPAIVALARRCTRMTIEGKIPNKSSSFSTACISDAKDEASAAGALLPSASTNQNIPEGVIPFVTRVFVDQL